MGVTVEKINVIVSVDNQQAIKNTEKFEKAMEESRKELNQLKPDSKGFNDEMQKLIKSTEGFAKNGNFNDIKRQFNALQREQKNATEGTKEYVIATAQLKIVGKRFGDIKRSMKDLQRETRVAEGFFKRLVTQGNAIRLALVGAFAAGIARVKGFGKELIDVYDVQAKADAQLKAAIISTNGAAGRSFEELKAQAGALQGTTLFGDEETEKAQALLLTFTNIRTDVFDKTIPIAQDYATALANAGNGTADMKSAVTQLGKALNDPIKGINALSRSGVQFDDQQKEQIKTLVESGNTVKAQTIILSELEKQFGGSAAAAAKAGAGGLTQLENVIGDIKESAGELLINVINPFIPKLIEFGQKADVFVKNLKNTPKVIKDNANVIVLLTTVLALLNKERILSTALVIKNTVAERANRVAIIASNTATKALSITKASYSTVMGLLTGKIKLTTVAQKALNVVLKANPIGLVITAIGLLVGAFVNLYNNSERTRQTVAGFIAVGKELFLIFKEGAAAFITDTRSAFASFQENAGPVLAFIQTLVQAYLEGYGTMLKGGLAFTAAIGNVFKGGGLSGAIETFKTTFEAENPLGTFGQLGERLGKAYINGFNNQGLTEANNAKTKEAGQKLALGLVDGFGETVDGNTSIMQKAVEGSIDDLKARISTAKASVTKIVDVEIQSDILEEIAKLEEDLAIQEAQLASRQREPIRIVQPLEIIQPTEVSSGDAPTPPTVASPSDVLQSAVNTLQVSNNVDQIDAKSQLIQGRIALYEDETLAAETRNQRLQELDDQYNLRLLENQTSVIEAELAFKTSIGQFDDDYFEKKNQLLDLSAEKYELTTNKQIDQAERLRDIEEEYTKQRSAIVGEFLTDVGDLVSDTFANAGEEQEEFAKKFILLAVETVEKFILLQIAQAQAASLAQPDSIASFGISGLARGVILTALIKTAFSVIKSQIQKFEQGGRAPMPAGKGGIPQGPDHSKGGIKMLDSQTGNFVGELQGGEPILSRNTYKQNKEVVDKLLFNSMFRSGAPIFMDGGIVPSAPSSSVVSNISNLQNARISSNAGVDPTGQIEALNNRFDRIEDIVGNYPTHLKAYTVLEDFLEEQKTYNETIRNAGG